MHLSTLVIENCVKHFWFSSRSYPQSDYHINQIYGCHLNHWHTSSLVSSALSLATTETFILSQPSAWLDYMPKVFLISADVVSGYSQSICTSVSSIFIGRSKRLHVQLKRSKFILLFSIPFGIIHRGQFGHEKKI